MAGSGPLVSIPPTATAGPSGLGEWVTFTTTNSPDQLSPPNCTSPGIAFALVDTSGNPFPGIAMNIYSGSTYTGQAPIAAGVTTYSQPTGGTFLVNVYSTDTSVANPIGGGPLGPEIGLRN